MAPALTPSPPSPSSPVDLDIESLKRGTTFVTNIIFDALCDFESKHVINTPVKKSVDYSRVKGSVDDPRTPPQSPASIYPMKDITTASPITDMNDSISLSLFHQTLDPLIDYWKLLSKSLVPDSIDHIVDPNKCRMVSMYKFAFFILMIINDIFDNSEKRRVRRSYTNSVSAVPLLVLHRVRSVVKRIAYVDVAEDSLIWPAPLQSSTSSTNPSLPSWYNDIKQSPAIHFLRYITENGTIREEFSFYVLACITETIPNAAEILLQSIVDKSCFDILSPSSLSSSMTSLMTSTPSKHHTHDTSCLNDQSPFSPRLFSVWTQQYNNNILTTNNNTPSIHASPVSKFAYPPTATNSSSLSVEGGVREMIEEVDKEVLRCLAARQRILSDNELLNSNLKSSYSQLFNEISQLKSENNVLKKNELKYESDVIHSERLLDRIKQLSSLLDEREKEMFQYQDRIRDLEVINKTNNNNMRIADNRTHEFQNDLSNMVRVNSELQTKLNNLEILINSLKTESALYKERYYNNEKLLSSLQEDYDKKCKGYDIELASVRSQVEVTTIIYTKEVNLLRTHKSQLQKELETLELQYKLDNENHKKNMEKLNIEKQKEVDLLRSTVATLRDRDGNLKVFHQRLLDLKQLFDNNTVEMDTRMELLERERDGALQDLREYKILIEKEMEGNKKKLSDIVSEAKRLQTQLNEEKNLNEKLKDKNEIDKIYNEIQSLKNTINEITIENQNLKNKLVNYNDMENEKNKLKKKLNDSDIKMKENDDTTNSIVIENNQLKKQIEKLTETIIRNDDNRVVKHSYDKHRRLKTKIIMIGVYLLIYMIGFISSMFIRRHATYWGNSIWPLTWEPLGYV